MTATLVIAIGALSVRVHRRALVAAGVLAILLLGAMLAALSLGAHTVAVSQVLATVFGDGSPTDELIIGELRLPRVVAGALVGVALGAAGGIFQSVTRNPLGSPDVVGFDSGAATGALVAMLVLHGAVPTPVGAVIGGALTAVAVFALSARGGVAPLRLVLVGIGAGALFGAINSLIIVRAQSVDAQSASVWLVGNLAGRGWTEVAALGPIVLVGVAGAAAISRSLTLGEFADERSASLGLHPGRVRAIAVALAVLLASGAVATAGPILFIALAAPQVARRLTRATGPNLVTSALTGAVLLVLADLAAREAFQPRQLPVGVLTGVVGGIYLIWLLGREWKKGRA